MTKTLKIIKKALRESKVMGFEGLAAFAHIHKHLLTKKLVPKGPHPYQALQTKMAGKLYAVALFGDTPDDVWGVAELRPHVDAYIGNTFKLRWVGHEVALSKENTDD